MQPKVQVQAGSVLQSPGTAPRIVLASPYGRQKSTRCWIVKRIARSFLLVFSLCTFVARTLLCEYVFLLLYF